MLASSALSFFLLSLSLLMGTTNKQSGLSINICHTQTLKMGYFFSADEVDTDVVTPALMQWRPPSTNTEVPVTKRAMSEARKAMVLAMSAGMATPPSGCLLLWASRN